MGAKLLEFDMFSGNGERMAYIPLRLDTNGKPQKPFVFGVEELTKTIERSEFTWGAQASLSMRRGKVSPVPMPMFGIF